ncbi:TonB-dependent receptor [Candidatus Pantoea multigeneris]|uniref:TonB-dependent receptor plug domain-containing protein n=1 Tax=Candidatus Pantoea multigeneris TaxID=2608357 RepID=A0ABX0RDN8_9GAMM|nr:TonB-dependent receptor [Pantoea multigeneris]NIF23475.1 TonB-dependent receptor plug domain-containing protein [Pantoea multigeneris]
MGSATFAPPRRRHSTAMMFATLFKFSAISLALVAAQQSALAQPASSVRFAIPAGSLSNALAEFGRQSGIQVSYLPDYASGKSSAGVQGDLAPQQALQAVLAGSGLTYSFTGSDSVTLHNAAAANATDDTLQLGTITVTKPKAADPADVPYQTAGSLTHLSGEQIDRFRGTSVGDLFSGIPGVLNGDGRNSGAVDVNIRGMQGQGRVPVIVDGASQETSIYQGYNGSTSSTYIDPDFIGSLDIERGASSGADATGATGGVVRISTIGPKDILLPGQTFGVRIKGGLTTNSKTAPAAGSYGGVGYSGGAEGTQNRPAFLHPHGYSGSIAVANTSDHFDITAAYAQRNNGNYYAGKHGHGGGTVQDDGIGVAGTLTPYRNGEQVLNTSTDNESWLLKGNIKFSDEQHLELGYSRYLSTYGHILGSQSQGIIAPMQYQGVMSTIDLATWTARYGWHPADNNLIDLKVDAFYNNIDNRINSTVYTDRLYPQYFWVGSDRKGATVANTSRFYTDFGDFSVQYGGGFTRENSGLPSGISLENTPGLLAGRDGWRKESNGFGSLEWKPRQWLTLSGNVRYSHFDSMDKSSLLADNYKRSDDGWSHILSLTVEPVEGFQIYGKYGSVLRSPSLFESLSGTSFLYPANNNPVAPERNKSIEFGINDLQEGLLTSDDKLRLHAAWFSNHISNYITRGNLKSKSTFGDYYNYVLGRLNLNYAEMRGFELSAEYNIGPVFSSLSWNHYTHVMFCAPSEVLAPGAADCAAGGIYNSFSLQQVPPRDTVTLNLGAHALDDDLTFGTRVNYVGSRYAEGMGSTSAPGQVAGSYSIAASKWHPYTLIDLYANYRISPNASVDVALDNLTDRFYVDALNTIPVPGPGRTLRAGVTLKF